MQDLCFLRIRVFSIEVALPCLFFVVLGKILGKLTFLAELTIFCSIQKVLTFQTEFGFLCQTFTWLDISCLIYDGVKSPLKSDHL